MPRYNQSQLRGAYLGRNEVAQIRIGGSQVTLAKTDRYTYDKAGSYTVNLPYWACGVALIQTGGGGGGSHGNGGNNDNGRGGGGGQLSIRYINLKTVTAGNRAMSLVVGAGGRGGRGNSSPGTSGGTTSIRIQGTLYSVAGGAYGSQSGTGGQGYLFDPLPAYACTRLGFATGTTYREIPGQLTSASKNGTNGSYGGGGGGGEGGILGSYGNGGNGGTGRIQLMVWGEFV